MISMRKIIDDIFRYFCISKTIVSGFDGRISSFVIEATVALNY